MPHSSHTQQTKTHEAAAGYSPRLCNDDLAPTRDQNWSWYNIFSFWMSDVHSMGGYVVAASFFTLGLASWQVLLCLLGHQVGAQLDNTDAHQQAEQNLPAGQPKRKEARRHYVAAHAFCSACWWASVLSSCAPTWWRSRARWPGCLTR